MSTIEDTTLDPSLALLNAGFLVTNMNDLPALAEALDGAELLSTTGRVALDPSEAADLDVCILIREDVAAEVKAAAKARRDLATEARSVQAVVLRGWARGKPLADWLATRRPPALATASALGAWLMVLPDVLRADRPTNGKARPSANNNGATSAPSGPRPAPAGSREPGRLGTTDMANAERFARRHGEDFRFVHAWNKWLAWDGRRWATDDEGRVERAAKEVSRSIAAEAAACDDPDERKALLRWAMASESRRAIDATIALARSELPVGIAELDRDPWALNVLDGTIDLRTGDLRPHRREDLITKLAPVAYDPDAPCPVWDATLDVILGGNADLVGFWQRLCGLVLTGDVSEQVLAILYGTGANGKSTVLNVLLALMGVDYAMKAPHTLLMAQSKRSHPTELADLFGKRLVVAIETAEEDRLNEVLVKELTGSDRIRARRMREDFWEFDPTHKVVLCTNHMPEVRGTDHAIWRRLKMLPFVVTIPDAQQDKQLPAKLAREYPGILAWCVRGCLAWQEIGLNPPAEVLAATGAYRAEQDLIGTFLDEECVAIEGTRVKASRLFEAYRQWAERSGEPTLTQRRFGTALGERGFERYTNNGTWYRGIGLRQVDREEAA